MNEANLAIARKVILCAGLLAGTLLFMYPHWWLSVHSGEGSPVLIIALVMGPQFEERGNPINHYPPRRSVLYSRSYLTN